MHGVRGVKVCAMGSAAPFDHHENELNVIPLVTLPRCSMHRCRFCVQRYVEGPVPCELQAWTYST